jgi:carbon-monoxide dehydrogenase large subunit
VDDLRLPDLLHAALVRSPHAHARIVAIDAAPRARGAGVVAVLTLADLPECAGAVPAARAVAASEALRSARDCRAEGAPRRRGSRGRGRRRRLSATDAAQMVDVTYDVLPRPRPSTTRSRRVRRASSTSGPTMPPAVGRRRGRRDAAASPTPT